MIPSLDIYRSAQVLVKQHGQDAALAAAWPGATWTLITLPGMAAAMRRPSAGQGFCAAPQNMQKLSMQQ